MFITEVIVKGGVVLVFNFVIFVIYIHESMITTSMQKHNWANTLMKVGFEAE